MDSYFVRIYRRHAKEPRKIVGVVEQANVEGIHTFRDLGELMSIFESLQLDTAEHKRSNISRHKKGTKRGG